MVPIRWGVADGERWRRTGRAGGVLEFSERLMRFRGSRGEPVVTVRTVVSLTASLTVSESSTTPAGEVVLDLDLRTVNQKGVEVFAGTARAVFDDGPRLRAPG